jgi:hypothetical protein
VQLKSQEPESLGERGLQLPGLFLGVAVDNNVIRLCRLPGYAAWSAGCLVILAERGCARGIIRSVVGGQRLSRKASTASGGR